MRKILVIICVLVSASEILIAAPAAAADASRSSRGLTPAEEALDQQLKGLGFGVGVGAVFDVGGPDRVKSAYVDSQGIVRVQEEDSVRVGAILETHYLFGLDNKLFVKEPNRTRVFYHGPQVSALLGENIIDGIGVGYIIALRRVNPESRNYALKSFNIGVGAMIQPDVQTLGDDLEENEPLPAGGQIRFKTSSKTGIYAMISVGF